MSIVFNHDLTIMCYHDLSNPVLPGATFVYGVLLSISTMATYFATLCVQPGLGELNTTIDRFLFKTGFSNCTFISVTHSLCLSWIKPLHCYHSYSVVVVLVRIPRYHNYCHFVLMLNLVFLHCYRNCVQPGLGKCAKLLSYLLYPVT